MALRLVGEIAAQGAFPWRAKPPVSGRIFGPKRPPRRVGLRQEQPPPWYWHQRALWLDHEDRPASHADRLALAAQICQWRVLPRAQAWVLYWVVKHDGAEGYAYVGVSALVRCCGISRRSVVRALEGLEAGGWMRRRRRRRRTADSLPNYIMMRERVEAYLASRGGLDVPDSRDFGTPIRR